MNSEKPPSDDEKVSQNIEASQLSPERAAEFLAGMEENIAGLEVWLQEERERLTSLEASPEPNEAALITLRDEIWGLAKDIQEQKDFVKESKEE